VGLDIKDYDEMRKKYIEDVNEFHSKPK